MNDDSATPEGAGSQLALPEVHKITFSSGIFSVIGSWPIVGGESLSPETQKEFANSGDFAGKLRKI